MRAAPLLCSLLCAASATAETKTLRIAVVAPSGTAWAQSLRQFDADLQKLSNRELRVQWVISPAVADERPPPRNAQLDGALGTAFCDLLAPSLRALRVPGLFRAREEIAYVLSRMGPVVSLQFRARGYASLGLLSVFSETLFFTREPARSLSELRRSPVWVWEYNESGKLMMDELGFHTVPGPISEVERLFAAHRVDVFVAPPMAALPAWWGLKAPYFSDLRVSFLPTCFAVKLQPFDALTLDEQIALREAVTRLGARAEATGRAADDELLNGQLEKLGMRRVPASPAFRSEFFAAAREARERLGTRIAASAVFELVDGWIEEYRAKHPDALR